MPVRLKDLPPAKRAEVLAEVEARAGAKPPGSRPSSKRRKKEPGMPVHCTTCDQQCDGEAAQKRHVKEHHHHQFRARLT